MGCGKRSNARRRPVTKGVTSLRLMVRRPTVRAVSRGDWRAAPWNLPKERRMNTHLQSHVSPFSNSPCAFPFPYTRESMGPLPWAMLPRQSESRIASAVESTGRLAPRISDCGTSAADNARLSSSHLYTIVYVSTVTVQKGYLTVVAFAHAPRPSRGSKPNQLGQLVIHRRGHLLPLAGLRRLADCRQTR